MFRLPEMSRRFALTFSLIVTLAGVSGCDKKPEDESETKGGDASCSERAKAMTDRLEPYAKVDKTIDVPFELPEASGSEPEDDLVILAGPLLVRVNGRTFSVPEGADPVEHGEYPEAFLAEVQEAIVAEALQHEKESELLNQETVLLPSIGVHPGIRAGAVEPFFAQIDRPTRLFVLAHDIDAPELPERPIDDEVEPMLKKLESVDDEDTIAKLTESLEEKVTGECQIAMFRYWVGEKTGVSTMTRQDLLQKTPLLETVRDCGCDEVDVDALEATLVWAMTSDHPPVVAVPKTYAQAFGEADKPWSDVVAANAE